MIKWKRPSGTFIETNDTEGTIEAAERLGWVRVEETPDEPKKGRGRPAKNKD